MYRFKLTALLILVALTASRGFAQTSGQPVPYYCFSQYQATDGLPNNTVTCCVQDREGFMWIGTRDGICRYDGYSFTRVGDMEGRRSMSGPSEALFVDREGLIWYATAFGRGFYNPYTGELATIEIDRENSVSNILQDAEGDIWFCAKDLYRYNKADASVTHHPSKGFVFTSAASDANGQVWCTCSDGRFLRYDALVDKFKEEKCTGFKLIAPTSGTRLLTYGSDGRIMLLDAYEGVSETLFTLSRGSVSCMMERIPGEYWIGTGSGIYIYTEGIGISCHLSHSDSEKLSISSDAVICLATDREGNIWAGTNHDGLNLWRNNNMAYSLFYPISQSHSIAGRIIKAINIADGRVWIGTEDGKLNYLAFADPYFHQIEIPGDHNSYQDIMPYGEELWISTWGSGIFRYDIRNKRLIRQYHFASDRFRRQLRTLEGTYLVAADDGVYRYDGNSDSFEKVFDTGMTEVQALQEDSEGRIWVGTSGKGIFILDSQFGISSTLESEMRITSLFKDSRGRMWVTSEGEGAIILDKDGNERHQITMNDGLPSNITCSVTEDLDGMIWLSTTNGLYMVDPNNFRIVSSFHQRTHLETNEFTYGAACRSSSGSIFMGTTNGMLAFSPKRMNMAAIDQEIFITSIVGVMGRKFSDLNSPGRSAQYSDKITVSYKDASSLLMKFSCPNYSSTLSNRYTYTFTSRGGKITRTANENHATLTNVGYGKHVFTVSLIGSNAPEATKSVEIYVRPPFIASIFAKLVCILLISAACAWLAISFLRNRRERRARKIDELEKEKQKELYESKNAFFMNITHEIRTPLSLIKMPLDHMIKTGEYSEKDMLSIQENTDRLLNLTNQLLDIRKLEQKEKKLEFTRQNLCSIVRNSAAWFSSMAEEQGVELCIKVPEAATEAMCARDSIEKIVSNLVTNALKYGDNVINVSLTAGDGKAVIKVDSNGKIIPARDSDKIFEKFVHGGKGTGLGLALSRTLAELHGGQLYLDTQRKDMNSFVLELPLEQPECISLNSPATQTSEHDQEYSDSRKDVLIVEDNQDFRLYLAESLSKDFNIFTAANGRAAIERLESKKIDLIVSDIMMPVMDGCELCNYVKSHVDYSHIPVILLTAAVGMDTRIETLQAGADGYIEKPFPIELLHANIQNIFKNREIAHRQFSISPMAQTSGVTTNKIDEEFMNQLHEVMLERMSDNGLSIDDLSSALNVSNSTLFRKVKANAGMNITEYIRISRLKRAAELLATRKYRVNEVADMVGFSSSSYFAANFQKQFSLSPSAFLKSLDAKE